MAQRLTKNNATKFSTSIFFSGRGTFLQRGPCHLNTAEANKLDMVKTVHGTVNKLEST